MSSQSLIAAVWTDTHCHLQEDFDSRAGSAEEQLERAYAAGVGTAICVGTDLSTSRAAIELARPGTVAGVELFASIGLHPHQASEDIAPLVDLVAEAVGSAPSSGPGRVVAVGECGLDYFYEHSPRAAQRAAFAAQLELALEWDLAVVVHTRDAFPDTFELLGDLPSRHRVVIHCFTGGPAEADRFLDMGCYLSFSGISTFKNAEALREALITCPDDRLLVETDAPFLAPVPHRGRPNEPAYVALVGEAAAVFRGMPAADLAKVTSANTRRAFSLDR